LDETSGEVDELMNGFTMEECAGRRGRSKKEEDSKKLVSLDSLLLSPSVNLDSRLFV